MIHKYRIASGAEVDLAAIDADDTRGFPDGKASGLKRMDELAPRLGELQEKLYACARARVLVVLQAMDTAGKDSTIRDVFRTMNPQGVDVVRFARPSEDELAHDYLWRAHQRVPASGQIVVFNRSHYEDVAVVRVQKLVPPEVWKRRYDHIVAFEKMLNDEGTVILKFFLHISKDEQKKRLQERLDDPNKRWKWDPNDLVQREHWDKYMAAYNEALGRTSTDHAPWYVVPANHKWYRNLVVASVLCKALEDLKLSYPSVTGLKEIVLD